MYYLIKIGSITTAQRAHKLLLSKGYTVRITRLQNPKAGDGCGYALKINSNDKESIIQILKGAGVNVLGVEDI